MSGQESGDGLADVLYGSTAPGGKLPYTIAKQTSDYGTSVVSGDDSYFEACTSTIAILIRTVSRQGMSSGLDCVSPLLCLEYGLGGLYEEANDVYSVHQLRLFQPLDLVVRNLRPCLQY